MYHQEYSLLLPGNEVSKPGGAGWEGSSCLSVLRCANREAFLEGLLAAALSPPPLTPGGGKLLLGPQVGVLLGTAFYLDQLGFT